MKKLVSIFLCIVLALPTTYINVSAEEDYKFYAIDIDAGNGVTREQAIVQNGEIFIPATRFSRYTRFTYDTEDKMFLIKGQEFNKAFKYVVVDIEKKRILVSGTNFYELSDCIDVQGEIYLPLCQMLPVLNADIHEVKDNVIYISNNKLSLAEVLYDFDISKYYFNMAAEFNNMDWAALFTIVPSYVWDTVVDIRFDRLDILYNYGEYNDYKDIFSEFLSDDNLYLKAMAKEPSLINSTIDFFDKTNSASKDMKTVYGWIEAAGETDISLEKGGQLLETLEEYYDSGELEIDEFKGLNDAWTEGTISFGDYIEILNYVYTYVTQVQDNREMLNAVYDVNSKISKKETARKAAKQVYDLYGEKIEPALFKEVTSILINDVLEELSPIGIYTATIKVAKLVIERFMPFNPSLVARIPAYSDVVLTSATKYLMADTKTDESTEDLRLSALLCMIASKKCFEIMSDVFEENAIYYQSNIEKIEQIIMGLYIAEENTEFDSFEHFEEYQKRNLKKIDELLNSPLQEVKNTPLVEYINKTVADVEKDFGLNYVHVGWSGSSVMDYEQEEVSFYLGAYYEAPPKSEKITNIVSYGKREVINKLHGKMNYGEIVAAIGKEVSLSEPEKFYNMHDDEWEYVLSFTYNNYVITYSWTDNPKVNSSSYVVAAEQKEEQKTETSDTTSNENVAMIISATWYEKELNLDFSINVTSNGNNVATWQGDKLCYQDGKVLAEKKVTTNSVVINIYELDEVYSVAIDDLDYGIHGINYISGVNFMIEKNGNTIIKDISPLMLRHYTGYWNAMFTIDHGEVKEWVE